MDLRLFFSGIIVLISSKIVHSDYLPIHWNASTDVGHSRNERLYEYPMFTGIASATCDLTANFCDSRCCLDPDCVEDQRKMFNCSEELKPCSRPFSRFDCNCGSDSAVWFPVLCYVFENPIYLGVFYKTLGKIEKLKNFLALTHPGQYRYRPVERIVDKKSYVFGSNILAYTSQNGSFTPQPHALLHGENTLAGLSLDCDIPVKYMKNQIDTCYIELTREKCEDGVSLGVKPYLLRNENSPETKDIPVVLKNLDTQQIADVSIIYKYSPSNYVIENYKGHSHQYFYSTGQISDHIHNTTLFETFWNDSVCHNIVVRAVFKFITNASEIQKVEIQLDLTNATISSHFENVYVKRVCDVSFLDVNAGSDSDGDNYKFNRGYNIGESLNFGYIRENGSHLDWEEGQLKIFLNGESCNRSRDVTFGYNTYSVCVHPIRDINCSRIREEITGKLESLTRGEYLAPYKRYSDPRRSAIPLLRSYNATTADCLIPIRQDVYIQYTTSITPKGFTVYEAVGAMMKRSYGSLSDGASLTMRVVFVDVTSSRKKPLSRFWERVYSPEGSENAWPNIFNVFDRPVTDRELEESTFWFVVPVIVACATVLVMRDLH